MYIVPVSKFDFALTEGAVFHFLSSTIHVHLDEVGQIGKKPYSISMTTLSPWINFNGNAEEAFNFYKSVFGGEFTKVIRLKDIASDEFPVSENDADKIMQITLPINGSNVLIGNDVPEFMGKVNERENRSKIHVAVESREEADRIFNGLSVGGEVEGAMSDSPWGTYFGMFRDQFGIEWVIESRLNN